MKKKLITIITTIGLIMSLNVSVLAGTLNYKKLSSDYVRGLSTRDINEAQTLWKSRLQKATDTLNQLKMTSADYQQKEAQRQELNQKIEMMDEQISDLMVQIDKNESEIDSLKVSIVSAEKDVQGAQADVDKQQKLMDQRVKAMYESGPAGYLSIILKADGFSDFVARVEAVSKIINYDREVKKDLDDKKEVVEQKEKVLEDKEVAVEKTKATNEVELADIQKTKDQEEIIFNQLKNATDAYDDAQNSIDNAKYNIEAIQAEIARRQRVNNSSGSGSSSRGGHATASQQALVNFAEGFLGTPYQWGGTTPAGFDCSGFVQYVYAHFGIYIPRTSEEQSSAGSPVSKSDLEPGDLVFFADGGDVHHVGMYIGGGQFIHSPKRGDVIKISSLDARGDFYCARRFLN